MREEGEGVFSEAEFLKALDHDIRRKIIGLIYDRVELSYNEILDEVRIGQGTLNFHLRRLAPFLSKTPKGTYTLSPLGRLAIEVLQRIRDSVEEKEAWPRPHPNLSADLMARRIAAFLVDAIIFFIFTGVIFDPFLWSSANELLVHLGKSFELHPWVLHPEHIPMIGEVVFRVIAIYSHIFFAVYIFITLLEAFKGQTPGKFLLGIRVVKVGGGRMGLLESGIRNGGKVFLLPLDLLVGLLFYRKKGYIRFFDYYSGVMVERVVRIS